MSLRSLPLWIRVIAALLFAFGIYQAARAVRPDSRDSSPSDARANLVRVVRVIDGDTIEVREAGSSKRVRYIGIDTPERVDCYYRESTAKNAELVAGKEVRMEKDISETDRFGRLLRYVYIDETFVNAELVRLGYAAPSTIPPDVRNADLFVRLAREAREGNRGLWDSAVCPNDG